MLIIDSLIIDAELSSDHQFENEVTDHPVEVGADMTDHSRPRPIIVSIDGVVSDTPLGQLRESRADSVPTADALAVLTDIRDRREPVRIVTSLQAYDSMLMQSFSVTKDASTGKALRFRATFKQVVIVANERVVRRVKAVGVKGKVDTGNKAPTEVTVPPVKQPEVNPYIPATRRVQLDDGEFVPGGKIEVRQDLARRFRSQF